MALLEGLEKAEKEKAELESKLICEQKNLNMITITEKQIQTAYTQAKKLFLSNELVETRQLINLYLDKVLVYKEHIEFYLNVLPLPLMQLLPNRQKNGHLPIQMDNKVANDGGGEGN